MHSTSIAVRVVALELGTAPVIHSISTNKSALSLVEELKLLKLLLNLAQETRSPTLQKHKGELLQRTRELQFLLSDNVPTSADLYQAASELANEGKKISAGSLATRVDDIRKREQFDRKMKQKVPQSPSITELPPG